MQPFIVAGTIAAAALLVVVSSPALLQGTPGAASHLALLPVLWVFFFALALVLQACPPPASLLLHRVTLLLAALPLLPSLRTVLLSLLNLLLAPVNLLPSLRHPLLSLLNLLLPSPCLHTIFCGPAAAGAGARVPDIAVAAAVQRQPRFAGSGAAMGRAAVASLPGSRDAAEQVRVDETIPQTGGRTRVCTLTARQECPDRAPGNLRHAREGRICTAGASSRFT